MLRKSIYTFMAASFVVSPSFAGEIAFPTKDINLSASTQSGTPDWTGPYAGGQLGYAEIDTNVAGADGDGLIGGLIAGYDMDMGTWVLGGGIDYDLASINLGSAAEVEEVLRLKVRGGTKLGAGLLYGTGGYAKAYTDTLGNDDGYFVGAGYEQMLSQTFSVGGELLYHEFDDFSGTGIDVEATTLHLRGSFRF